MSSDVCPDLVSLRDFVAGRPTPEGPDALRAHVSQCPRCRDVLAVMDTLAVTGWPSDEMPTAPDPDVSTASLYLAETEGADPPAPEPAFAADWLDPPGRVDSLGRLAHYEVLKELGRGGMGVVLEAFEPPLQRTVAIKVLRPGLAHTDRARRRFLREARSAAAISHANVVTIHAVGEHRGLGYLVMENVAGRSLQQRINVGPRLATSEVLRIGLEVALGLDAAHRKGVIHRDIKPANVMLQDADGRVKITDFGLALVALDLPETTSIDHVVGTPAYMSPEQVRDEPLDFRSDLFSLGCVLYVMVAGQSPFRGRHAMDALRKVLEVVPPPLHEVDPSTPRPLSDLVATLLLKDPAGRPGSAAEVVEALRRQLNEPVSGVDHPVPVPAPAPKPAPGAGRRPRPTRGPGRPWLAASAALLAVVGVLAVTSRVVVPRLGWGGGGPGRVPAAAGPVLVVGNHPSAQYKTLAQALSFVNKPNTTIRLYGPGVHHAPVRLEDPELYEGLTIEGDGGPVISGPGHRNTIFRVENAAGVTLRNLTILSSADQFGLVIEGRAPGLTLEGVSFQKNTQDPDNAYSHVWLGPGAHGTDAARIVFRRCTFGPWPTGLVLEGDASRAVAHVVIEGCRFEVYGRQLELLNAARDVRVVGNLFLSGENALHLDRLVANLTKDVTIANNTFFRAGRWLNPVDVSPDVRGVRVINNAVLEPGRVAADDDRIDDLVRAGWEFKGNLAEGEGSDPVVPTRHRLDVLSRNRAHPDFLRPPPGSPLATSGLGGDWPSYVGAIAPAGRPN